MRRLGLLEERCLWPAPHVARRVRGGLETRPHFLFCSGCVWRKGLQVQGWCGSNGKHFFSFLLTLSILSPFFTWSLPLCTFSGSVQMPGWPPLLMPVTPHALPPLCTGFSLHFCVLGLAPPLFLDLPVHPSLFVSPGPVEEEPGYFPYD